MLVALSAGGTGGHIFPAAALAQELAGRGCRVVVFTDRRGAKYREAFGKVRIHVLPAGAFNLRGLPLLLLGTLQALVMLAFRRPDMVVGFGGYPSVPAVLAAQMLRIRTLVHEQNAVMGRANALMARRALRIATSYTPTRGLSPLLKSRAVMTGPLVRPEIAALHNRPYPELMPDGMLRLFVMGGSQGARVLADIIPAALAGLAAEDRARLSVVQQCRAEDLDAARAIYQTAGIAARLEPFIRDVPEQLAQAHLFIGRAGGTVAEVTAAGRPAIFVPYPHHADQQQKINADAVAAAGGAWVMTEDIFTPEALRARIEIFLHAPSLLKKAAKAAKAYGRPEAAARLADMILVA